MATFGRAEFLSKDLIVEAKVKEAKRHTDWT
jgi:hypothetical protein